jgi:hypothetical protein
VVLTALGIYQTAVSVFAVAVAVRIWRVRPDRFQNVSLALVIVLSGLGGFGSQGLILLTTDHTLARVSQALLYGTGAARPFVYLAFIGTLPTVLARPFAPARLQDQLGITGTEALQVERAVKQALGGGYILVAMEGDRTPSHRRRSAP